ncbi:MAG: restriction endonuclease subunit S [Promethearchaeati archaeon SRVP18_Atabeyarchaeia-1]
MDEISERLTDEKSGSVDLPKGWIRVSLGDYVFIAARIGWRGLKKSEYLKEGPLFLAVKDIREDGTIDWDGITDHLNDFRYSESPEIQLKDHDVLVTKDGTIGKIGFLESVPSKATVNSSILVVRPCLGILPKFLFYYFRGPEFQDIVEEKVTGTAVPHLFQHDIKRFQLNVPPFVEQKRIVAKIEELFQELRSSEQGVCKAMLLVKRFHQWVFEAAVVGELTAEWREAHKSDSESASVLLEKIRENLKSGLGSRRAEKPLREIELPRLPECWAWTTVGDISEMAQYGYTSSSSSDPIGPKMLRITDIQHDTVDWRAVPYCRIADQEKRKFLLGEGDLVFARTGATVGKSYLIKGEIPEAIFASYLIRVVISRLINKEFVYYFFHSDMYWSQIRARQVGTGQPNVNSRMLSEINLPLPPLPEQQEVVQMVKSYLSMVQEIERNIGLALQHIEKARKSILKSAFEGGLVPRDPSDEPASILLERMKAKRAASKKRDISSK